MATFELFKSDTSTAYYYNLRATDDGEVIMESDGYATKYAALQGIDMARSYARYEYRFELKEGIYYTFVLKASNGEILGRGKKYRSMTERDHALLLVINQAPLASVEDLTDTIE